MARQIELDVWGERACWPRPDSTAECLTYPVPTPGGMRGVLSAICAEPTEFYWQIQRIEVLRPIRYAGYKRGELTHPGTASFAAEAAPRQTVALRDVRYRVTAAVHLRPSSSKSEAALEDEALSRIESGRHAVQPYLGRRDFPAGIGPAAAGETPIALDMDLGYMLYDTVDLRRYQDPRKARRFLSYFYARLEGGVLTIPPYDSPEVMRPSPAR